METLKTVFEIWAGLSCICFAILALHCYHRLKNKKGRTYPVRFKNR